MPTSQYELQSGHCCFEDVSQSSNISVLFMSAISSCDFSLNMLISFVCLKSWRKDSLFGWVSNFSINFLILSLRICFAVQLQKELYQEFCNPRCCSRSPRNSLIRCKLVNRFANLVWVQLVALLELSEPFGIAHPLSSCIPLSQCKQLVVCRRGRLHATLFGKIAILSLVRVSNCTNIPYFDEVSKYFCMEQSSALSSRVGFSHTIFILHQIHYCEEHGLSSSFETLSSRSQSTSDYWSQFIRVPDVVDILGKSFWSQYIVLQLRINSNTTRMSSDCSERQNVSGWVRVPTILKPFFLYSSSGQNRYPIFNWPSNLFFLISFILSWNFTAPSVSRNNLIMSDQSGHCFWYHVALLIIIPRIDVHPLSFM